MITYNYEKGIFGGRLISDVLPITRLKLDKDFGGKHFKLKFKKDGFCVTVPADEFVSVSFKELKFQDGSNFFVAMGDQRPMLFNMDSGEMIPLEVAYDNNFVVSNAGAVYPVGDGKISDFIGGVVYLNGEEPVFTETDTNGYIVVRSNDGNINAVNKHGEVVVTLSSDKNAEIRSVSDTFQRGENELHYVVKDSEKNVLMTENEVLFSAPASNDIYAFSSGDDYMFNACEKENNLSHVTVFDSKNERVYKFDVSGIVKTVRISKTGEMIIGVENGEMLTHFVTTNGKVLVESDENGKSFIESGVKLVKTPKEEKDELTQKRISEILKSPPKHRIVRHKTQKENPQSGAKERAQE